MRHDDLDWGPSHNDSWKTGVVIAVMIGLFVMALGWFLGATRPCTEQKYSDHAHEYWEAKYELIRLELAGCDPECCSPDPPPEVE